MDSIEIKLECEQFLKAPVYQNTKVGEITLKLYDEEILKSDILIAKTIEKKTVLDYLYDIIKNYKIFMLENYYT